MNSFCILLVACWLTSNDVSCIGSNETTNLPSDKELIKDSKTELTKVEHGRKHLDNSSESDALCPCYLNNIKGRAPVFQNLDVNQFGIQRLVMFLYYSDKTNQLEIHIPNLDKQKVMPDLYEQGDILEPNERPYLIHLFKRYIDLIQPNNKNSSEDKQLHTGENKHKTTHDEPDYETNESSNVYNSKSSDYSSSDESMKNHNNYFKKKILVNGKPVSLNILKNKKEMHTSSDTQHPHSPSYLGPRVIPLNNNLIDNENKHIHYTSSDSWNNGEKVPHSVPSYNKNKLHPLNMVWPLSTLERKRNLHPDINRKYFDKPNQHTNKVNTKNIMHNHPNSDESENDYPYISWTDNRPHKPYHPTAAHYFSDDDSSKYHKLLNNKNSVDQSWPLDAWLQEQTKKLHKPSKNNNINVNKIKLNLEKILLANDMTVSPYDGNIINRAGQIVNMDNFSLRPILIGGPIALRHVLNNNNMKFPNSPYLKAVLLISSNPTKVLGSIPLGEKNLPSGELTYSGEVNEDEHDYNVPTVSLYNLIDDNKVNLNYLLNPKSEALKQTRSDGYNKEFLESLLKGLLNQVEVLQNNINHVIQNKDFEYSADHSISNKQEHSKETHDHLKSSEQTNERASQKPIVTISNHTHTGVESSHEVNDKSDNSKSDRSAEDSSSLRRGITLNKRRWKGKQPVLTINKLPYWIQSHGHQGTEYESREMYGDLQMPGFRIIPGKLPRNRHYSVESINHLTYKPTSSEVYRPNVDSNDSLDLYPGFRIIGGHAATSSGAPLSNKGRSGHINESVLQNDDAE